MDIQNIKRMIEAGLPEAQATVESPDNVHFQARVVSPAFAGKLPLARHRLVYATLGEHMGTSIHALSVTALTPDEAGNKNPGAR